MHIRVKRWGNSLALRIPKTFASETHIQNGSVVDVLVTDGKLVVKPEKKKQYSLKALLAEMKPKTIHKETKTGKPVGNEIW